MIPDHLRIQPGQQALTPEQEREARRFARERINAQLSTEPVDEQATEALLKQAYVNANLPLPTRIRWVDGPLPLVAALTPHQLKADRWGSVWSGYIQVCASVQESVGASVWTSVWESMYANQEARVWGLLEESVRESVKQRRKSSRGRALPSVTAYLHAAKLACCHFFHHYLAPNELHALAHFNEQVAGYWLGQEEAILVRRPRVLARDEAGRLHSATGKCVEYRDGWGVYAWHGVRVSERIILRPETLTSEDWLNEQNVKVRRILQERMGERFVSEMGGSDGSRLLPGQPALTPVQEAEAERFAQARMAAQLATSPVDEQEAEHLLRQAYAVAGLPPPRRIHWLDGPLQYVGAMAPQALREIIRTSTGASVEANVQASVEAGVGNGVDHRLRNSIEASYRASVSQSLLSSIQMSLWDSRKKQVRGSICARVEAGVGGRVGDTIRDSLHEHLWDSVPASIWDSVRPRYEHLGSDEDGVWHAVHESTLAYKEAGWLACARFFEEYLAPNAGHAFSRFNELVSGYWLGEVTALLVRRPRVLSRDQEGRLHSATGKCIEYQDGWGFYAWHGVRVPERVILAPETLTREDFQRAENVEVRRVIQERMGERFVSELGGQVIDASPRGTLYEVRLPEDDPERVARYVQVQDASTERRYFLRVPPTIQTAAEAVAWTFQVEAEDYHPAQEM